MYLLSVIIHSRVGPKTNVYGPQRIESLHSRFIPVKIYYWPFQCDASFIIIIIMLLLFFVLFCLFVCFFFVLFFFFFFFFCCCFSTVLVLVRLVHIDFTWSYDRTSSHRWSCEIMGDRGTPYCDPTTDSVTTLVSSWSVAVLPLVQLDWSGD